MRAARAIIIKDGKLLVMFRNKHGNKYYTLVGGKVDDDETIEQALIRETHEETGMKIIAATHVFTELHKPPYNEQYIYYCNFTEDSDMKIQTYAEEAIMNKIGINTHKPMWVDLRNIRSIPFRTPQLLDAVLGGIKDGFPETPQQIN